MTREQIWWYWGLHVAALGAVLGVLFIVHLLIKRDDGLGIWGLVVGKDRRVSTSKLQVAMWTVFIPAALLSIVLHALKNGQAIQELGLGNDYLFLLGFPAAAALGAKTITSMKVAAGTKAKVEASSGPDLRRGVVDAVGDDEGNVEIFDLQYLLFNVVALVYFVAEFVVPESNALLELPTIPTGLFVLTGASAVGYLSRKALEKDDPHLIGVYPEAAAPGEKVWLRGVNLTIKAGPGAKTDDGEDAGVDIKGISLGGREADVKRPVRLGGDEVEFFVPKDMEPGPAAVRVVRQDGATTTKLAFHVLEGRPKVRSVYPAKIVLREEAFGDGEVITILGSRFGEKNTAHEDPRTHKVSSTKKDEDSKEGAVTLGDRPLKVKSWRPERIQVFAPTEEEAPSSVLNRSIGLDLVVYDAKGDTSEPQTVILLPPPRKRNPKPGTKNGQKRQEEVKQG